ncbi:MAG: LysM peptidoglycan-binding domain-containing protein [Elusimicrobia bacterium]|nr:LysM peptidoglycan-binding domain-containing protein [Elusimicrobiota bacterium]
MKKLAFLALLNLFAAKAEAVDFTYLYPGARQNAMGIAFAGVADDPYTIFYNPAGLSSLRYVEVTAGLSRRFSPIAPAGEFSAVYIRPIPDARSKTAGLGYHAIRQSGAGDRDVIIGGLSDTFTLKYFQKPIQWGGNFRIISLRFPQKSHFGAAVDGGILLDSIQGLKTGLVVSDLGLGLGKSYLTITLGNSYRRKDTLFALDWKIRGGHHEIFAGIEQSFFNGLVHGRAGRGIALDGESILSLGLGVNTLPWIINMNYSIPIKGFHKHAGHYEMNIGYRFNAPGFIEKFVGDAAAKSETIRKQIEDLRYQKANLETDIAKYQVNKGILQSELTLLQTRLRELEARIKNLEFDMLDAEYRKDKPRLKRTAPPKIEKWPKQHKVETGDTLRSIASRYYGNPNLWERIYEANEKKIKRGLPVEGSILEIPAPKQQ